MADAGVEVRRRLVGVAHAVLPRRRRHQLHQARARPCASAPAADTPTRPRSPRGRAARRRRAPSASRAMMRAIGRPESRRRAPAPAPRRRRSASPAVVRGGRRRPDRSTASRRGRRGRRATRSQVDLAAAAQRDGRRCRPSAPTLDADIDAGRSTGTTRSARGGRRARASHGTSQAERERAARRKALISALLRLDEGVEHPDAQLALESRLLGRRRLRRHEARAGVDGRSRPCRPCRTARPGWPPCAMTGSLSARTN